jgi:hypothetical protein
MSTLADIAQKKLGIASENFVKSFEKEVENLARKQLAPEIKTQLLRAYDELADLLDALGGQVIKDDATNLKLWRHLFEKQLEEELSKISVANGEIFISVLDKDKLGYGDQEHEGEPTSVDWLVYYIEGMLGEFAFIDEQMYLAMRGEKKVARFATYGRFGKGFLIGKESWEREKWEKRTKKKFSQVRHPISGWKPYRGFETALSRIEMSDLINKALENTTKLIQNMHLQ